MNGQTQHWSIKPATDSSVVVLWAEFGFSFHVFDLWTASKLLKQEAAFVGSNVPYTLLKVLLCQAASLKKLNLDLSEHVVVIATFKEFNRTTAGQLASS